MTVNEYIRKNNPEKINVLTDEIIILHHTHRTRTKRLVQETERFMRTNVVPKAFWNNSIAYNTFGDKEITHIKDNTIFVHFTIEDWIDEVQKIFKKDKRDFDYKIEYKGALYSVNE